MAVRSPLLEGLFDYAGVFPPAALPVGAARTEYLATIDGPLGWVVGPMLVLASQLDELLAAGEPPAALGLVADRTPRTEVPLRQLERRVASADAADAVAELTPHAPVLYLESPDPTDLSLLDVVTASRAAGLDVRAKIRTGGATAEAFPDVPTVAAFLTTCVERGLPCKATAGLHHPVRTASAVPEATEHGFLNLLAAVRCALAGDPEATEAALATTNLDDLDVPSATFRGVGRDVAPEAVRSTFRSIGSCSVEEPGSYLRELGML